MNLMVKMKRTLVHQWTSAGRIFAFTGACLFAAVGFAAESITITARPRYPWNGKVDLKFTIDGTSGTKYDTSFTAKDVAGGTNLTMRTLYKSNGTAANVAKEQLLPGTYNWVWDATTDCGIGFVCERVQVEGKTAKYDPLYMVIDLSGGSSAKSYPVSYLDAVPSGGWSDAYKTTKLVMRKIPSGSFTMGDSSSNKHKVTITKSFYICVFEVTQQQYQSVVGSNPSGLTGQMRPVENLSYATIRGATNGAKWPASSDVDSTSFIGLLRARLNIKGVDLPTSAQWEYACRAGTTTELNNGLNTTGSLVCTNLAKVARYWGNQSSDDSRSKWDEKGGYKRSTVVGMYNPNKWGLYDMHGNVWEMCLDWYSSLGTSAATDPKGPSSGSYRVIRGGDWFSAPYECVQGRHIGKYNYSYDDYYHTPTFASNHVGFRFVVNQ